MATVYRTHATAGRRRRISTLRLLLAAVVAAVLVGGYRGHWSWTGISGNTATLWDWISLLLLPITVATLPIWLSKRHRLTRERKAAALLVLAVFAAVVLAGYLVPWNWTGFEGNALWDWINLLLLPLVVATFPLWPEIRNELRMHHRLLLGLLLAGFAVAVAGGYAWGWGWTGFRGNTLWDGCTCSSCRSRSPRYCCRRRWRLPRANSCRTSLRRPTPHPSPASPVTNAA